MLHFPTWHYKHINTLVVLRIQLVPGVNSRAALQSALKGFQFFFLNNTSCKGNKTSFYLEAVPFLLYSHMNTQCKLLLWIRCKGFNLLSRDEVHVIQTKSTVRIVHTCSKPKNCLMLKTALMCTFSSLKVHTGPHLANTFGVLSYTPSNLTL